MLSTSEGNTPPSLQCLRRPKRSAAFQAADSASGVLKEMGFTYKKRDNKKYIYEQTNILEQRHTYLQTIRKLRQEHKNLVYTDETWVNAHHNNEYIWVDSDGSGGWKVPSGKGRRLIILHAGGVDGWVEGADLVFR